MKNLKIRPLGGLYFALLFILNVTLVTIAVIKSDDLYVAYAILLSSAQFYIYEKFKISRIFFECDTHHDYGETQEYTQVDETGIRHYDIHLN